MIKIIGKKIKMISLFKNKLNYSCTIIYSIPCKIIYKIKNNKNNFTLFLGYDKIKKVNKPLKGFFKKHKCNYYKKIIQLNNVTNEEIKKIKKKIIDLNILNIGDNIDVTGFSIGKGFQGVVKRYNFSGVGGKTHGQHNRLRSPGSIGAGSSPSRVFKGMKMAGRMGNKKVTIKKLKILDIDYINNLILINGSVPGKKNNYLIIKKNDK
ncbi:MAG: 50S ribosomal protein L3 [Candidatus Shikimatogenerans bostrichidophilus]|nr:MAG: 50S ribosomal protein L3 [Candidatus Shikimatogenerans bostrichidophilus]